MMKKIKDEYPYVLMALPAIVVFTIFFVVPILMTFRYSFLNWTNFSKEMPFIGLDNYRAIFSSSNLKLSINNTLILAVLTVVLENLIALPTAVFLNTKVRGNNFFRAVYFCPAVLSTLIVGYVWGYILSTSDYGFLNQVLENLGIQRLNYMASRPSALIAVLLVTVWQWFGWSMVIYLGNLQSINDDYYEAAALDGANAWQKFWHITLPGLSPAIKVCLITNITSGLKAFDIVLAVSGGGPAHQTETIMTTMFSKFADGRYGQASAFGMVFLAISLIMTILLLRVYGLWEKHLD